MEKNKINLNKASRDQLSRLDGMGGVLADEIIRYRIHNGGFRDKNELSKIPGFDDVMVEKVKQYIYVD